MKHPGNLESGKVGADAVVALPRPVGLGPEQLRLLLGFGAFFLVLSLAFWGTLTELVRFSLSKERNSYLILVPFISVYLVWIKKQEIPRDWSRSIVPAVAFALAGTGAVLLSRGTGGLNPQFFFSLKVLAWFLFIVAGGFAIFGGKTMLAVLFPSVFLIFGVPMPAPFAEGIEIFLQHASAEAAYWMLSLSGVTLYRNGLEFQMPGIAIKVAQECSGYNSSFVLFMLSTLAGHLFLRSARRRWALTLVVIPLAILRNGFRITTISLLCVHLDPGWIDSPLHHRGGPVFFALSMIPFLGFLWWLRKSEISGSLLQTSQTPHK